MPEFWLWALLGTVITALFVAAVTCSAKSGERAASLNQANKDNDALRREVTSLKDEAQKNFAIHAVEVTTLKRENEAAIKAINDRHTKEVGELQERIAELSQRNDGAGHALTDYDPFKDA